MIGMLASIQKPEYFERLIMIGPSPCYLNDPPDYMGGFEKVDLEGLLDMMDMNYIGWANNFAQVVMGIRNVRSCLKNWKKAFVLRIQLSLASLQRPPSSLITGKI